MGFDGHEHCDANLPAGEEDGVPRGFKVPPDRRRLSAKLCHRHISFFNDEVRLPRHMRDSIQNNHLPLLRFSYCGTEKNLAQRLPVVITEVLPIKFSNTTGCRCGGVYAAVK